MTHKGFSCDSRSIINAFAPSVHTCSENFGYYFSKIKCLKTIEIGIFNPNTNDKLYLLDVNRLKTSLPKLNCELN